MTPASRTGTDPIRHVDDLLRAGARGEIAPTTGRLRAAFEARAPRVGRTSSVDLGDTIGCWLQRLVPLAAAALLVAASLWLATSWRRTPIVPTFPAPVARAESSRPLPAALSWAARPERLILEEARRLRTDLERGVKFVRAVMPRFRSTG